LAVTPEASEARPFEFILKKTALSLGDLVVNLNP